MKKFKFICGEKPTPMIAVFNIENQDVWNEEWEFEYNEFIQSSESISHIWSIGAYLIYNVEEKVILAYKYNESINSLIWLLRIINQPLEIEINTNLVPIDEIKNDFE